jgi:hypothetical protein
MNCPLIAISRQCFASLKELRLVSSAIDEYNTLPWPSDHRGILYKGFNHKKWKNRTRSITSVAISIFLLVKNHPPVRPEAFADLAERSGPVSQGAVSLTRY